MSAHLKRAQMLIQQGRDDLAEKELGLVLSQTPDHPHAHALLACCLSDRDEHAKAEEHARQAVAFGPDFCYAHYAMGYVLFSRNRLKEAEAAIQGALRIDPENPDYHAFEAHIHCVHKGWSKVIQAADRALRIDPEHVNAKNLRIRALRGMGHRDPARQEIEETLAVDPEDPQTHANLGWLLLSEGDRTGAKHHFREALRLDPDYEYARVGILETLRAGNLLYRGFSKFFLLMDQLSRTGQWKVILGLWVAYIVLEQLADSIPALKPWMWPILVAYLVFALGSWLAKPLANLTLRVHPLGRLALSRDERIASNWIGALLLATFGCIIGYLLVSSGLFLSLAVFFFLMVLPTGAVFSAESPWPRNPLILYAIVVGLVGLFGLMPLLLPIPETNLLYPRMAFARGVFPISSLISLILGNVLSSIQWKK